MKKTYLTVLTIITILCIIFGSLYHIGGFFGKISHFPFPVPSFSVGRGEEISFEEKYSDISAIDMDVDFMNVRIDSHNGSEVVATYTGSDRLKPIIEVKNGTLNITQKQKVKVSLTSEKTSFTLMLPSDKPLKEVEVDVDMGNVDMNNFITENLIIDTDMGNIEGGNITADNTDISADMGNVSLTGMEFASLGIDTDMGNVDITSKKSLENYAFSCNADAGNININGKKVSKDYMTTGSEGTVRIDTDMGNIAIDY